MKNKSLAEILYSRQQNMCKIQDIILLVLASRPLQFTPTIDTLPTHLGAADNLLNLSQGETRGLILSTQIQAEGAPNLTAILLSVFHRPVTSQRKESEKEAAISSLLFPSLSLTLLQSHLRTTCIFSLLQLVYRKEDTSSLQVSQRRGRWWGRTGDNYRKVDFHVRMVIVSESEDFVRLGKTTQKRIKDACKCLRQVIQNKVQWEND